MTVQELEKKYGINEAELYVYAYNHLKCFKNPEIKEQGWKYSGAALRQLDWLLAKEVQKENEMPKKEDDDWRDPTEDEPDGTEVPMPKAEPELIKEAELKTETVMPQKEKEIPYADKPDEKIAAWEEEKFEMEARLKAMQQELTQLRKTHLTTQRDSAEKQAELLAKAIHEKQLAESKIAVIKEDAASVKHLTNVRIKELEERNESLEHELKEMHAERATINEELKKVRQNAQEITEEADAKCSQQWLKLHEAERKQDELFKVIHEKEIALAEEKERTHNLLEKYNTALLRIGEIVGKIEKARVRMREISAEFDMYVNMDMEKKPEQLNEASGPSQIEEKKVEQIQAAPVQQQIPKAPNPETVKVLGKPLHEIYPEKSPQEQAIAKQGIWRKIASFF